MSRRHDPRALDTPERSEGAWEYETWAAQWGDTETTTPPADWQVAWADTTISTVEKVWSEQGAKLYAPHRYKWLRDDLHTWLLIEAQKVADWYVPVPCPDPEGMWAATLWRTLRKSARWHFGTVAKTVEEQDAYHRGVTSTNYLTAEVGDAWLPRHAIHGDDWTSRDPADVVGRVEALAEKVRQAETYTREQGSTYTTETSPYCSEPLCTQPVDINGQCRPHYEKERRLWGNVNGRLCNIPGCGRPHRSRGLCNTHQAQLRGGRLPAEYMQYAEAKQQPATGCQVPGCDRPHDARGYCAKHYAIWRKGTL
ncbi:hypothetical protein FE374_09330 [Georgenia yuyongxinii]|uniref:Uncharacterized protein n=1 Tax=Georgenia yuyongxinii TaxID=2589797 RepID=A0A5B8C9P7_9MICO|nr:hypothetical protein [Georgenia yuyongxinii]QDC24786.1 hypothetical protein FE374_09330 [Georgenia yuyongxinii]